MNPRAASTSRALFALLLLPTTAGCMTTGVVNKALDRYPTTAYIRKIERAALDRNDLYLLLDVESLKFKATGRVLLKVPIQDIGEGGMSEGADSFAGGGLQLKAPYVGVFQTSMDIPSQAEPVTIHNVPVDPGEDYDDPELAMADWIYTRSPGIYVMNVPYFLEDTQTRESTPPLPAGEIERNGYLLIVRREKDHAPREQRMWGFSEYTRKRRSLLFLTPLTVVGDIVTFPFQLLSLLGD